MLTGFQIENFRAFRNLKIDHFGQVNLIVGKNSVGKTSLLESLWFYSAPFHISVLFDLLRARQEWSLHSTGIAGLEFSSLFNGAASHAAVNSKASLLGLGIEQGEVTLTMNSVSPNSYQSEIGEETVSASLQIKATTKVEFEIHACNRTERFTHRMLQDNSGVNGQRLGYVAPFLRVFGDHVNSLADWWSRLVLTESERRIVDFMSMITPVERIALVLPARGDYEVSQARFLVKREGQTQPEPLKRLGDGVERLFQAALAAEYAAWSWENNPASYSWKGSGVEESVPFVLIDEVESGLHYSILEEYWSGIFQLARERNIQIFATTHSWDCIEGFQSAAEKHSDVEGTIVRLERGPEDISAVCISEADLKVVTREGIEIR